MGVRKAAEWLGLVEHRLADRRLTGSGYDELPGRVTFGGEDLFAAEPLAVPEATPEIQIALVRPRGFTEVRLIGEYLRRDIPVLLDLSELGAPEAERIIDFASGAIVGRRGTMERVSKRVFFVAPAHTTVLTGSEYPA